MTLITFQDGRPVLRDGKVGVEQGCCCDGNCLCCSCVERVAYTPSTPGANAQPFAGIAPAGGSWAWDSISGVYYGEFPCHYVEYAFSEYASQIFPNAVNAGADAAYSGGGTWSKFSGFRWQLGETRCTGSTEEDCQPCLAAPGYLGPLPSGNPLPTLAQLQKQCGIYHPCTPCESCSNGVDGCGVPGINQGQERYYGPPQRYPYGIPWPPPDGTCPCKPCDLLCFMRVGVKWKSKVRTVVIDGRHWPDCSEDNYFSNHPLTPAPALSELTLPSNTVMIGGQYLFYDPFLGIDYLSWSWKCNTAAHRERMYPGGVYGDYAALCDSAGLSCYYEPPPEESEWWDQEYDFTAFYPVVRIVGPDGCNPIADTGDCWAGAEVIAYGGIKQILEGGGGGIYPDNPGYWFMYPPYNCDFPFSCGTPCYDLATNPFP